MIWKETYFSVKYLELLTLARRVIWSNILNTAVISFYKKYEEIH